MVTPRVCEQRNQALVRARLPWASKTFLEQPQQGSISCVKGPVFSRGSPSQLSSSLLAFFLGRHAGSISS